MDGLCWEPCKPGFTASWNGDESPDAKSLCIENCRDNEIENWFACEVPEKIQPMEGVRGDGVPMICGDKLDNVHGVCYLKCADGYDAFLGSCLYVYAYIIQLQILKTCCIGYYRLKDGCTLYDSEERVFETEEQQGKKIFDIPITDAMSYSMDITINDLSGQWPTAFTCGYGESERFPRFVLHHESGTAGHKHAGMETYFTNAKSVFNGNDRMNTAIMEEGKTYHLEIIVTQTKYTIVQDGVVVYDENLATHMLYQTVPCYFGHPNPERDSADVSIRNIMIKDLPPLAHAGCQKWHDINNMNYKSSMIPGGPGSSNDNFVYLGKVNSLDECKQNAMNDENNVYQNIVWVTPDFTENDEGWQRMCYGNIEGAENNPEGSNNVITSVMLDEDECLDADRRRRMAGSRLLHAEFH